MLSCIVGTKSVNSLDYEEVKLREWSNKGILKCPECGEKVLYCKGDYKIPYFRHEVGTSCDGGNSYYEPMTEEHIEGIRVLYNKLKEIEGVTNLEVEKYIKNTKQRPDIYFEYENKRYCIEYQCSPISTQYNKRHELYQLEGIEDIWILGTEKYEFNEKIFNREFDLINDNLIIDKKTIKEIEDEIDFSKYPLLYLNSKVNRIFKTSSMYALRGSNNKVMMKTSRLNLIPFNIDTISISSLVTKINNPLDIEINRAKYLIKYKRNEFKKLANKYGGAELEYNHIYNREAIVFCFKSYFGFNSLFRISFQEEELSDIEKFNDIKSKIDNYIYGQNCLYEENKEKIVSFKNIMKLIKDVQYVIENSNRVKPFNNKKLLLDYSVDRKSSTIVIYESSYGEKILNSINLIVEDGKILFGEKVYLFSNKDFREVLSKIISDEIRRVRYGEI